VATSLKDLIAYAETFRGVPYVYGGTTPKGFDCSGYVQYVFKHFGIKLPRTSQDQSKVGVAVDDGHLSPGDLIFSNWGEGPNSHVAIYAGNGKLLEAPRTGETVRVAAFDRNYGQHVDGYRRVTSKKKGILDSIEGIAGDAVGQALNSGGVVGGLLQFPSEITGFFTEAASGMASTVEFFTAFFRPSTYVRIGAGFMGMVFLMAGIGFLLWEAKEG
jgi:hypothetical protein